MTTPSTGARNAPAAATLMPATAAIPTAADRFDVYADPAGHPFCLCVSGGDAQG
ncbi:hypothetical protein [Clavibacter michiganensis]|uniref:hypothetical protein n=1 Tax=Clavibacter michiganensis TaxID=28447 RepID=UPI00292F1A98|nr:hypothetical protein [Clavibacter michiganensis]